MLTLSDMFDFDNMMHVSSPSSCFFRVEFWPRLREGLLISSFREQVMFNIGKDVIYKFSILWKQN